MTEASALLETARRHLCDADEIVDRFTTEGAALSDHEVVSLDTAYRQHMHAVNKIIYRLLQLTAETELLQIADEARAGAARWRRLAEM